jgi:hypothetical protein
MLQGHAVLLGAVKGLVDLYKEQQFIKGADEAVLLTSLRKHPVVAMAMKKASKDLEKNRRE